MEWPLWMQGLFFVAWGTLVTTCLVWMAKKSERKRSCTYCDRPATHVGEGEKVCRAHIYPDAANEYRRIEDAPDEYREAERHARERKRERGSDA